MQAIPHEKATFAVIMENNLDAYLINHFKKMPKLLRRLNLLKKDELLKTLLESKHVLIIEIKSGEEIRGIVFAV